MNPAEPIIDHGKSLLKQLLAMAQTRLELLAVEIEQEKLVIGRNMRLMFACAVFAWLAGLSLILSLAFALPADVRSLVLAALGVAFALAALACYLSWRSHRHRRRLLSRVISQLAMDRGALGEDEVS